MRPREEQVINPADGGQGPKSPTRLLGWGSPTLGPSRSEGRPGGSGPSPAPFRASSVCRPEQRAPRPLPPPRPRHCTHTRQLLSNPWRKTVTALTAESRGARHRVTKADRNPRGAGSAPGESPALPAAGGASAVLAQAGGAGAPRRQRRSARLLTPEHQARLEEDRGDNTRCPRL